MSSGNSFQSFSCLKVYLDQLKIMLACYSEEEFLDCSMSITSKWSEPAVSYFERELKSDIIKHAGKWLFQHKRTGQSGSIV
jgi:hypothetical protein